MTVMTNVVLVLKDSEGNIGIVKTLTDKDIIKIADAITDVGQVVDPATHMPIEATTASVGVVQLATAQDIKDGTANKVVDAKELADAIGDIKLADSSKFSVVAGANIDATGIPTVAYNNGTFTFNYLKGAKGDTGATGAQGPKGDTGPQGIQGPKGDTPDISGKMDKSGGTFTGTVCFNNTQNSITYKSASYNGYKMHDTQSNALYIEGREATGGDSGGMAITNDGVTIFGAGDTDGVLRIVNEDAAGDGSATAPAVAKVLKNGAGYFSALYANGSSVLTTATIWIG